MSWPAEQSSPASEPQSSGPRLGPLPPDGVRPLNFDDVFRENFLRVARTLRSLGIDPDAIDDATQDVFVIIHSKLDQFDGRSALTTWIYGVTFRVAMNARRKSKRRSHEVLTGDERYRGPDAADKYAESQAARFVQAFCASLSEAKRDAFVLCVLEERPVVEVAGLIGVDVNTLYARVRAAKSEFGKTLRRYVLAEEKKS
jgi:RNA polymerase sigma-70 factor, ECF subfamily